MERFIGQCRGVTAGGQKINQFTTDQADDFTLLCPGTFRNKHDEGRGNPDKHRVKVERHESRTGAGVGRDVFFLKGSGYKAKIQKFLSWSSF